MDNWGFMLYTEDDIDDFIDEFDEFPPMPNFISGRNIKTSCYGLFLIALDQSECKKDTETIQKAIDNIENITDCTAFSGLYKFFPPSDMSYTVLINLASTVILLNDISNGNYIEYIPEEDFDKFDKQSKTLLKIKPEIIELEKEYEQ